jgi:hypothetical protein
MGMEFKMAGFKLDPAASIVYKFRRDKQTGEAVLGPLIGLDRTTIYRWQRPLEDGGSGGIIPAKHIRSIINAGLSLDPSIRLEPADFVPEYHEPRTRKKKEGHEEGDHSDSGTEG